MNELHLFAGVGGGILGGILCGHTTVCAVEIEPYCRDVLLQRQRDGVLPVFPIWDDVTTFDGRPWRDRVDVVCGGFPCQDISIAGKGEGITGERSGLWKQYCRVIDEIRPAYVFAENSPNLRTRGLHTVVNDLVGMGYGVRWGTLGYGHLGGPHLRKRLWVVAHALHAGERGEAKTRKSPLADEVLKRLAEGEDRWCDEDVAYADQSPLQPLLGREDDGVASRLDRQKAIGNGQVPAVAAFAFQTLKARFDRV